MVTVVKTPQGHKIVGDAINGAITSSSGALVTSTTHGLTDGDYIYVDSDIDEYNGFWYVDVATSNTFRLYEYQGGTVVPYYQDLDITYYRTLPQEWSSIFLPIVYKATNNRWPTNTVDTVRTISSTADDSGYLDITASGALKTGMNILEYVKISDSPVAAYNGVWQIVEVVSSSRVIIDAPYTASSLAGANIQYYYNNYQVKVKIYAGLPAGHPWEAHKPFEEVAELSLTPDADNLVMFSIADKIQGKVTVRNNTTLYSLPLNIDAFTAFYIATAESYDDSDNYSLTTTESSFTDDTFVGYAITGKLPFKNVYSGHYSDYTYVEDSPALWLTMFSRLIALEDRYFDISFIKNIEGNFTVQIDKYIADYMADSEDIDYEDQGIGVYRIPIEADGGYDSLCVLVKVPGFTPDPMDDLSLWLENGSGAEWTDSITPNTDLTGNESSENKYTDYGFSNGQEYTLNYEFETTVTGAALLSASEAYIRIKDSSDVTLDEFTVDLMGANTPLPSLDTWTNLTTVNSEPWITGVTPTIQLDGSNADNTTSEQLFVNYAFVAGVTYRIDVSMTAVVNSGSIAGSTYIFINNVSNVQQDLDITTNSAGTFVASITFVATSACEQVGVVVSQGGSPSNDISFTFNSATVFYTENQLVSGSIPFTAPIGAARISIQASQTGTGDVNYQINTLELEAESQDDYNLTEEICIDIISCNNSGGLAETFFRLLEDNDIRITESGDSRVLE